MTVDPLHVIFPAINHPSYRPSLPESETEADDTKAETLANAIAARYGNDGQCWVSGSGIDLEELLRNAARTSDYCPEADATRYELSDGSAIVTCGGGWDLGIHRDRIDLVLARWRGCTDQDWLPPSVEHAWPSSEEMCTEEDALPMD